MINHSMYSLETIRNDGEFILYRARHQTDATPSSVFALTPASEHPPLESLRKMENEYSLRTDLDSGWSVSPIALVPYKERTMLVLTDPGGEPLDRLLGRPMELTQFLPLAIGLTSAIGQVHGRGLIHKDIKPANVLVNHATGQVRLMGFGIASRLPRERQAPEPPGFIAGTLPYMAPEQTGRMNRSIDSRSDLYAFGVTLYEMLTGRLPFTASDPMVLVHCHIARQPIPPCERLKSIPGPVSAIIMKLLAKTAEERYQTASGAASDLRRCLTEWETQHRIDEFPLGEQDTPDRLLIPEKLYGRESEIGTLLASFARIIASGRPELVLVSGYSGIGKSSVVNELHKPLVPPRGLFASGKFDQYKRDIPYSTLAQAFQSLTRRLLAKNEADLATWRAAFLEALGPNGRLMIDLVPELKHIIGDQPPVPDLPPQDARRRFELVLRRFIGVFARPDHPLALFLDDLQWLDEATLDLLEDLLNPPGVQHLMLIGAYRDNEVTAAHPLMRKLEAIRNAGANVQEITLTPLAAEDVRQFIADALRCEPERAAPLAQLVHEKTAGNPFFLVQFLHTLVEEGWLAFDHEKGRWSWDLNRIHAKRYRDNVVDLMVGRLNRLPLDTQKALQELACLGNIAPVRMLSFTLGKSPEEVRADLWDAVRLELVEHLEDSYKFVHDRVQEAAYMLIPEELRDEAHLRIGRQLAAHIPPEQREEAIFEIVNQYNRGVALITSRDELEQMAELNLLAGKRAKASTAYAAALKYLVAGAALLLGDSWERRHELIFALELHRAECEFLTGALGAAEERLKLLSARAANTVDRATVACLRLNVYTTLDQSEHAVEVCLEYLAHLGVEWSPHPTREQALGEYERIWSRLDGRKIEDLIELPLTNDPAMLGTLDVLTEVVTPALFTDENLLSLVICRMVNLSLEHGNSDGSCFAYVWLGMIAGPHFDNYEAGFQFGRQGYELVEKRGLRRYQARTYMSFGNLVMPWTRHVRMGRDLVRRAFDAANKAGDLTFAAYSRNNLNTNLLAAGDPLAEAQREAEQGLDFAQKARFGLVIDIITAQLGLIRMLRGLTPTFGTFDNEQFDERRFERHLASQPDLTLPECWYWIRKLQACVLAGDYRSAIETSLKAQPLLWTSPSFFETAEYEFYGGLARAAFYNSAPVEERPQHLEVLAAHYRQLEIWAENCPENFENRAALVGAEIARIEGRALDAERLYEEAIRSARANGFLHNEALAYELAARFYAARGFEQIAHLYLRNARQGYRRWGADGKVRQLDQLHPHLGEEEPATAARGTIATPLEQLELATVLKVSQAVSGEMVLDKLIETLMLTAVEHAGAQRGLLILQRGHEQRIEAEATISGVSVIVRQKQAAVGGVPESIIQFVTHTREHVILDDAAADSAFSADTYIHQCHARSILCLPLITQAKLIGVLYLENNLTPHVFTPKRIAVLKLLASQAAISLENTRLYSDLEEREAKIRRLVEANIIGIVVWNLEGGIIEANEAFLHMVKYSRGDLVSGRVSWKEITPDKWREADEQALTELATTGFCEPYEKEYFCKDGNCVSALVGAALFEGRRDEGVAFVLDLTERKQAEEKLRQSEAYLAEAQRVSHTGNWAWSPVSNAILYWSEECYRILGYDPAQGLPSFESSFERISPEDRPALVETIERAVREKADFQIEYRLMLPDGTRRNVRILSHPVLDASGKLVEFVGTVMDVTEQKRAEEERRAHLWFLESTDRINLAMQRSNDVELMTSGVMQEALEIFACDRACLIYPCDPDAPTYRTVMEHTSPKYGGALALGQNLSVTPEWGEAVRRVLHHPGALVNPTVSPGSRERYHVASMLAIAVRPKGDRPYLFAVHSARSRAWTAAEVRLFEEIARRLGDALTSVLAHRNLLASEKELRRSALELQRSESYLAEGQRLAHLGSWAFDHAGFNYWSPELFRIHGLDPVNKAPTVQEYLDCVHPQDRESMANLFKGILAEASSFDVTKRIVRPDGELRYVRCVGAPIVENQRLTKYVGSAIDVTEQELLTQELRSRQAYLTDAQRLSHTGSFGWKPDSGDIVWSDETYRIFEYDLAVKPTIDLVLQRVHPEDRVDFQNIIDRASAEKYYFEHAYRLLLPDGKVKHVHALAHALEDASGNCEFVGAVMNVTERKWAEEELRQSEAYLAEAQKLSHTGSWAWSPDQDIRYWSEECYRVLSFDPQHGLPRFEEFFQRIHPDDQPGFRELIQTAIREKAEWEADYRIVHPGGAVRNIHVVGHPVLSTSGHLVEFVGTVIDITERKRTEEALRKTQTELAHVARVATVGELTTSIAHEINQPLGAIVNNAGACLRWLAAHNLDEARQSVEHVIQDGHRASEIINRIRALVRKAPPQKDWMDMNETIRDVLALTRPELEAHRVAVETRLPDDVPAGFGDRIQLQQVLLNLIMNAIEAMSGTEGPRLLRVGAALQDEHYLLVTVQDSGPGFDVTQLNHVFDAFYSTKPDGLGMGLAISRSIIEAHDGRLWATKNEERGAAFYFTLPIGEPA